MIYEKRLTIPKNTAETAQETTDLEIHPGVVEQVEVMFPPGPAGLAHLRVLYWDRQIWPTNPDSDFYGDDVTIHFAEDLEIVDPPYIFTLSGWNTDDTYPHTITFRCNIVPHNKILRNILGRIFTRTVPVPTDLPDELME